MGGVSTIRDDREDMMNALEGKGVLVTGSSGLLGQAVVENLTRLNLPIRVTGLSRNSLDRVATPNYVSVAADLSDVSSNQILETIEFSHLVHCAAVIPTSMVDASAIQAAEMNSLIDDRIVSLCHDRGAKLIYVSGASVYGLGQGPWNENSSTCAPGPYVAEKLLSEHKALNGLIDCVVFRVTAPYGPRQIGRASCRERVSPRV